MAARISDRSKRAIIDRVDMAAIVGESVRLKRVGNRLAGLCPFHEEKTPSFSVNPHEKVFYCFGCGAHGDAITFVRELLGFSYVDALEHLAQRAGVAIEWDQLDPNQREHDERARSQRRRLLDLNAAAQAFFVAQLHAPVGQRAREYLQSRDLTRETVKTFGVGCAPDAWDLLSNHLLKLGFTTQELLHVGLSMERRTGNGLFDRFRDRLMFPVYTRTGDIVAFGGRTLSDDKKTAKYMNSPECELDQVQAAFNKGLTRFYRKGEQVFGLLQAIKGIKHSKMALVVEGNLDVMMLHQHGETHAVCPMGTALTRQQLVQIRRLTDRVALVFDGDNAGRDAARKAVPACIEAGIGGSYVNLPDGEDPDTMLRSRGVQAFRDLVNAAPSLIIGYIDGAMAAADDSIVGKRKTIEQVQQVLSRITHPIDRDLARSHLANKVGVSRDDLNRYLRGVRVQAQAPDAPLAIDPVNEEPQISELELGLVRVLCRVPQRIPWVIEQGCMDDIRSEELRAALMWLGERVSEGETQTGVQTGSAELLAWLRELPDSRVRRAMLRGLVEVDLVDTTANEGQFSADQQLTAWLDRLESRELQRKIEQILKEVTSLDGTLGSDESAARLFEDLAAMRARLDELNSDLEARDFEVTLSTTTA